MLKKWVISKLEKKKYKKLNPKSTEEILNFCFETVRNNLKLVAYKPNKIQSNGNNVWACVIQLGINNQLNK